MVTCLDHRDSPSFDISIFRQGQLHAAHDVKFIRVPFHLMAKKVLKFNNSGCVVWEKEPFAVT